MMVRAFLVLLALALGAPAAGAQERVKVGYWTSGFSVGFGAVLEAGEDDAAACCWRCGWDDEEGDDGEEGAAEGSGFDCF